MAPTSAFICLLLFITVSALLLNSRWDGSGRGKEMKVNELSEDSARFRVLFGMMRGPTSAYSPAEAPNGEVAVPAPLPSFRPHVGHRQRKHRRRHIAPMHSPLTPENQSRASTRHQRLVVIVVASVGAAVVVLGIFGIVACKKRSGRAKRSERLRALSSRRPKFQLPTSSMNKVSFEPEQELFYLNVLAQSDHSLKEVLETKNLELNGSMSWSETDVCVKQTSECENASDIGSVSNVRELKHESDISNISVVENFVAEDMNSDEESFHSVCSSNSPDRSFSDASEKNFCQHSANCSPSNFSYQDCKTSQTPSSSLVQDGGECSSACNTESIGRKRRQFSSNEGLVSDKLSPNEPDLFIQKNTGAKHIPSVYQVRPSSSDNSGKLAQNTLQFSKPSQVPISPNKPPLPTKLPPVRQTRTPPPPPPPIRPPLCPNGFGEGRPPPPPPCPPQLAMLVGKDGAPLPKLKPLHWVKVRATSERSMIWDKIRSNSFEFDEKMIESLFGYNSQSSSKPEEARNKSPSSGKNVMEHKRLQNITILMKALNASSEEVFNALMQGRGLSIQQLEALVRMAPTKEEEEKFSKYEGDINNLDPAEKFLDMVLGIPYAFARSEVMLFIETFEDEVAHLRKSFEMLEEACEELRSSRLFLRLLEAVLKTGNRMNVGTIRGGARAFKLDALLKLADVKGTDGKTTLLHFVVQEMVRSEGVKAMETTHKTSENITPRTAEEKEDDYKAMGLKLVSGLSNELGNVKKTASIDLDVLISSVSNLSDGLNQIKQLVEDLCSDDRNINFVQTMNSFIDDAEATIKKLKDEEEQVLVHVREITEYYHGDVSKEEGNPLRIFVIVRDFLGMLDHACKEVRSSNTHQGTTFPFVPCR